MDEKQSVEAWADALLDQHRTAPRRQPPGAGGLTEDDPFTLRLMVKLSGQEPDPERLERIRAHHRRHQALERMETVVTIGAVALFALFVFAWLAMF